MIASITQASNNAAAIGSRLVSRVIGGLLTQRGDRCTPPHAAR
jgi:hypothetical protein